ncbi:class I SAM-dependent methyltransferase [Halieaceae bacterium IMCC14734]|uniref:Class I SAM-dependent methyltransferase n=1 Tax=Candidatus Litorirhabdus singularis TaxID=2518993 RepID=A0ABT3TG72_9GAMM|nr:class I SAM-dependent methyltransferase [Candidatus Litorirhabdus singularis]
MSKNSTSTGRLDSSFRDPSGFVFSHEGSIYRQINAAGRANYDQLMQTGLYKQLIEKNLLIPHTEIYDSTELLPKHAYKIIQPSQLPYISYPYEWCFSQLKDAAILTLKVQANALKFGMSLKDASAYNVQFLDGRPFFIDTLSFESYREDTPWVAYKQFCQHFLAPLALMAYTDIELAKLLVTNIDGIPLPLASKLLPMKTRLNLALTAHIHLHAKLQVNYASSEKGSEGKKTAGLSRKGLQAMVQNLANVVNKLEWKLPNTEWGDYYQNTNYSDKAADNKRAIVHNYLQLIPEELNLVQDLGANTGVFSRVAATHCKQVISQDIDPVAVEANYREAKKQGPSNITPLIQNLFAPSPSIGWKNCERDSFTKRAQCDALLALALIHHIALSNNVPLENIAEMFAGIARWVILEFVPKSDSQVERLLATREDIFPDYTEEGFERSIDAYFTVIEKQKVSGSCRVLYLLKRH